jgi:benzoyl-CoA reductase subunit B
MWIGAGLWHDMSFYQALEERLGAVFVWSMYLPFAGAQYIREIKGRPLEALASRICSMNEVLHLPPWMTEWLVSEAGRCGIDAAVVLVPPDNRLSQSGTLLAARPCARRACRRCCSARTWSMRAAGTAMPRSASSRTSCAAR